MTTPAKAETKVDMWQMSKHIQTNTASQKNYILIVLIK